MVCSIVGFSGIFVCRSWAREMEGISVFSGDFRLSDFGAGRGKQRLGGYAIFWLGWKGNYVSLRKLSPRFPRPGAIIMAPLRAHICAAILRARNDFARFSTFHIWGWNVGVGAEGFVLSLGLFWLFFRELSLELAGRGARLDKGWGVCDFLVWLEGELACSPGAVTPFPASGGDHRVAFRAAIYAHGMVMRVFLPFLYRVGILTGLGRRWCRQKSRLKASG